MKFTLKKCFDRCFREEKIQTELLYPILLRSGLARETLRGAVGAGESTNTRAVNQ